MSRVVLIAAATLCLPLSVLAVTKLTLGQDVDWPPYAFKDSKGKLQGFGKDIADGMTALCADVEITVVQVKWADCWTSDGGGALGKKIDDGTIDGCLTYTNTLGVRQKYAEFSGAILDANNGAGLMTLLNADGRPKVDGMSDLAGTKVVDVGGWAPTGDTIFNVTNKCTGDKYDSSLKLVVPAKDGNDAAMEMLSNGTADAMYVYANQAHLYQNCTAGATDPWNCDLWSGLGKKYAYVQTGQQGYQMNGTTLILGKKGSDKAASVNDCLYKFLETKEYYDICVKHDMVGTCYRNEHFPGQAPAVELWNTPTNEITGDDCSGGYCPCSVTTTPSPTASPTAAPTPEGGVANGGEGQARHAQQVLMAFFLCVLVKAAV